MSTRVCVDEHFTSTNIATMLASGTMPRLVTQQRSESSNDGDIQQLSDPVPMIDTTLRWRNDTDLDQQAVVEIYMAARSMVVSNPNALEVSDQYGIVIGSTTKEPDLQSSLGSSMTRSRLNDFRAPSMAFQTTFDDRPGGSVWLCPGTVGAGQEIAVRYFCSVTTPGTWRNPKEENMSVKVNYARIALFASIPMGED